MTWPTRSDYIRNDALSERTWRELDSYATMLREGPPAPRCPECGCLTDDHSRPADVLADDALEEAHAVLRGYGPLSTCIGCGECTWKGGTWKGKAP